MSGPAPETERERQLRQFASKVLAYPDADGLAATVDLLPIGYPDDLPSELVDYADLRFLGSVVTRRDGVLLRIELLFEMATGADDLLERYERGLLDLGWQPVNQPGLHRGGFEAGGVPRAATLINRTKRTRVYLQSFTQHEGSLLRVHYRPPADHELTDDTSPDAPPGRSPLPALKAPPGVRLQAKGMGGGGHHWASSARAMTNMASVELEAHFAKQLELEGWGRVAGSADEFFAWSSWLLPSVPPTHEWHGVLLVLADRPGERDLSLWADSLAAR